MSFSADGKIVAAAVETLKRIARAEAEALGGGADSDAAFLLQAAVYAIARSNGITDRAKLEPAAEATWAAVMGATVAIMPSKVGEA